LLLPRRDGKNSDGSGNSIQELTMKQFPGLKSRSVRRVIAAAAIAVLALAADEVIVKKDVNLKADKSHFAEKVEAISSDTKLQVISRDEHWLRVRAPDGKEGFLAASDLPPKADLASVKAGGQGTTLSNDAALRGLQDDAESYAKNNNYTTDGVEQMIAWGKQISEDDLQAFAAEGHVGPASFRR
jgi:hypothetical protein